MKIFYMQLFRFLKIIGFGGVSVYLLFCDVLSQNDSTLKLSNVKRYFLFVDNSYIHVKVPFGGFMRNNELFNMNGLSSGLTFYSHFRKNKRLYYGVSLIYEQYKIQFYDLSYDMNHYYDTQWNRTQYNLGMKMNYYVNTYPYWVDVNGLKAQADSMLLYFGGIKSYFFKVLEIRNEIGYTFAINERFSINTGWQFYDLLALSDSYMGNTLGSVGINDSDRYLGNEFMQFFVFLPITQPLQFLYYQIYNAVYKRKHNVPYYFDTFRPSVLGSNALAIRLKYNIFRNHFLSLSTNVTLINPYYLNSRSSYPFFYEYNSQAGCLGCGPLNGNIVKVNISVFLPEYFRWMFMLSYGIKF